MIDHVTLRVKDLEETKRFYSAALKPLGYKLLHDDPKFIGFGKGEKVDTWFTVDTSLSGPTHISWQAESKQVVDAFYEAALAAGGVDNGGPGIRAHYHENYYGAFVLDPNGNNAEAVFGN